MIENIEISSHYSQVLILISKVNLCIYLILTCILQISCSVSVARVPGSRKRELPREFLAKWEKGETTYLIPV